MKAQSVLRTSHKRVLCAKLRSDESVLKAGGTRLRQRHVPSQSPVVGSPRRHTKGETTGHREEFSRFARKNPEVGRQTLLFSRKQRGHGQCNASQSKHRGELPCPPRRGWQPAPAALLRSTQRSKCLRSSIACVPCVKRVQSKRLATPSRLRTTGLNPDRSFRSRSNPPKNRRLPSVYIKYSHHLTNAQGRPAYNMRNARIVVPGTTPSITGCTAIACILRIPGHRDCYWAGYEVEVRAED